MKWREIEVSLSHPAAEALAVYLSDTLSVGVSMDDPAALSRLVHRGGWEAEDLIVTEDTSGEVRLRFYVGMNQPVLEILAAVKRQLASMRQAGIDIGSGKILAREVDEKDWAHAWKAFFKPLAVGDRLWIQPVWEKGNPPAGRVRLWLDPGMAFGTGSHPTTRLCLEVLDREIRGGETVLDVGTGSGILAISAILLGASRANGVDIDETAVTVAKQNSRLNQVDDRTDFQLGVCEQLNGPAHIIVANIVANVVMDILPCVLERLTAKGLFIASGIIRTRREEVCQAISSHGLKVEAVLEEGEWIAVTARREHAS